MINTLIGRDFLSISDLSKQEIELILDQAAQLKEQCRERPKLDLLNGRILATMFYEPSTRTRLSFESAMLRLGGGVISVAEGMKSSSASKGETLYDAAQMVSGYADVIVQRHPAIGSAQEAADGADVPVINAGDGIGEHPTQALLDTFTIREELGRLDNLTVTMLGDLRFGRTVHSLARLLTLFSGVTLNYVSPEILRMPKDVMEEVAEKGIVQTEHASLRKILPKTDVLYVTRVQKERFEDVAEYEKVKSAFVITPEIMTSARKKMIVMHPLPRITEISMEVDDDPRAAYFRQMEYGLYVRMALLAMVLGKA
jgi:aspartate carbamoyltransferase